MSQLFADTVRHEIAEEQAGALGRVGAQLQHAVELFRERERQQPVDDGQTDLERERLLWDLAERVESFIVQREACNLRNSRNALAFYGVPREALVRVGAKRPRR
jgi:hypothetical protein